jgi:hypothetical protein
MRAHSERSIVDVRRDAALAWNMAAFSRAKKLPALDTIMRRIRSPYDRNDKRRMPWQEMLANSRAWQKALEGQAKKKD